MRNSRSVSISHQTIRSFQPTLLASGKVPGRNRLRKSGLGLAKADKARGLLQAQVPRVGQPSRLGKHGGKAVLRRDRNHGRRTRPVLHSMEHGPAKLHRFLSQSKSRSGKLTSPSGRSLSRAALQSRGYPSSRQLRRGVSKQPSRRARRGRAPGRVAPLVSPNSGRNLRLLRSHRLPPANLSGRESLRASRLLSK